MGYAIIDLNANYKGIKRVTQVTPVKPSSFINNTLNSVVFEYKEAVNNIVDIKSIVLTPANSTAYYRFSTTNRSDLILDTVTGRITLLGGFTGGKVTIYAKNSQGETKGTCELNNLPAVAVDTYTSPNISKLSYPNVESGGGSSTPSYTYSYIKDGGSPISNGKDATKSFELQGTYPSDVSIDSNTGVVTFEEYSDTTQDRQVTVRMTITLPGNVTAYKDATVTQTRQGTQPEEHSINIVTPAYISGIAVNQNTSSVWNITAVGVGILNAAITGTNADKFTASISDNKLTVTTNTTNTSGSNYTATITVGDGTYSDSINISQPYMTYYISSVEYQGDPQLVTTGKYKISPTITVKNSNGETLSQSYSDLSVYNAIPGAEQYTVSSVKSPVHYGLGVVNTTTGDIEFDSTATGPSGMQYTVSNTISYNTSNSSHSITYNQEKYSFVNVIYNFNDKTWTTKSLSTKYRGCSRNDVTYPGGIQGRDYNQTFYRASNAYDYMIDLESVNAGDEIYIKVSNNGNYEGAVGAYIDIIESDNNVSSLQSNSSTRVKRIFANFLDMGGLLVHKVESSCSDLIIDIYDNGTIYTNGQIQYYIKRNSSNS